MKTVDFFDGAETGTAPTIGNISATDLNDYANDAAYEAANAGSPTDGNIYFNTTLNKIRLYDGSAWVTIPTSPIAAADVTNTPSGNLVATDVQSALNELQSDIDTRIPLSQKGAANGVAPLNASSKIDSTYLPSYVDDVEEYANLAAFPVSGETGKIYVALDTNKTYRWTGSVYVEISPSDVNSVNGQTGVVVLTTTNVAEGTNLYFTDERAQDAVGGILTNGGAISFTYDDVANEITADVNNDSITNVDLANMASGRFKARHSLGTGDPEDITGTQATTMLDNFVGDSGSGGTKGLVPAPAAGDAAASKFLKADGTWTVVTSGVTSVNGNTGAVTVNAINELTGDVTAGPASGSQSQAATIAANAVTDAKFRQSAALSVVGRSANTTGNVADISAASDHQVLRRSGTSIGFGSIDLSQSNAATGTLPVGNGGTGQSSYVDGELLIGNTTGNTLTKTTLTAGAGINITNGSGSITIASTLGTSVDLATEVTGTLPIANGGTGQTSQTAAFDALAPTTTKGDLIVNNGSDNVRQSVGTDGQVLVADSAQANGVRWGSGAGLGVALVSDVKAAGSDGGTFTSGAFQTRVLNTLVGGGGFASIASNQITLQAGTYLVKGSASAYFVDQHKAKLRNITDSTDTIIGTAEYATNGVADSSSNRSFLMGTFTIASAKVFEVQHRCTSTQATNGFGVNSNYGVSEVYTQLEILKI
jgi:hypothetical protein